MSQETVDKDIISTLKVNNKGWDIRLFQNQRSLEYSICHECEAVCCDAVELGCDHNDDQIFLFCSICLEQLVNKNNHKCPINEHDEPLIIPNRASRRHILKSIVCCPYSIAYPSNNNEFIIDEENSQIVDTSSDQKEGNESQYNPPSNNKCKWKGKLTLDDLITKHIRQCMKQNNPSFILNIKFKQLEQENNILNEQIIALRKQYENEKEAKDKLKAQVMTLTTKLNANKMNNEQYENELTDRENMITQLSLTIDEQSEIIQSFQKQEYEVKNIDRDLNFCILQTNRKKKLEILDNKTIKYSGCSQGFMYYFAFGPVFETGDKVTVQFEITNCGWRKNHEFGFSLSTFKPNAIEKWSSNDKEYYISCISTRYSGRIRANGSCYLQDDFVPINDKTQIEHSLKSLNLLPKSKSTVTMGIDMTARKGWIGDGNESVEINLPKKDIVMILGVRGDDAKYVKAKVL